MALSGGCYSVRQERSFSIEEVPMTYPGHPEIEQIIWGILRRFGPRHQIAQLGGRTVTRSLILGRNRHQKELVRRC